MIKELTEEGDSVCTLLLLLITNWHLADTCVDDNDDDISYAEFVGKICPFLCL